MNLSATLTLLLVFAFLTPIGVEKHEITNVDICLPGARPNVTMEKVESYVTCIHHSDAGHDYYYDTLPMTQCRLQKIDSRLIDVVSLKDGSLVSEKPIFQRMTDVRERWPKCDKDSMGYGLNVTLQTVQGNSPTLWYSLTNYVSQFVDSFTMPSLWNLDAKDLVKQDDMMRKGNNGVNEMNYSYHVTQSKGFQGATGTSAAVTSQFSLDDDTQHEVETPSALDDTSLLYGVQEMSNYYFTPRTEFNASDDDLSLSLDNDVQPEKLMADHVATPKSSRFDPNQPEPKQDDFSSVFDDAKFGNFSEMLIDYGVMDRTITASSNGNDLYYEYDLSWLYKMRHDFIYLIQLISTIHIKETASYFVYTIISLKAFHFSLVFFVEMHLATTKRRN